MSLTTSTIHAHTIPPTHQPQNPKPTVHPTPEDAEIYITQLGVLANLILAISKGSAGYLLHSQALLTDSFHSLTDLVADLITLATVSWHSSTTTIVRARSHWHGKIKIQSLGAVIVSVLLLFGGVAMGWTSLVALHALRFDSKRYQAHGDGMEVPDLNATWVAVTSILVKEWLYQATIKVARERKSAVLASNAMHHRIDSLTSVVALLTMGCAHLFGAGAWCDPVGGLVIAGMVIKSGWGNTRQALVEVLAGTLREDNRKLA